MEMPDGIIDRVEEWKLLRSMYRSRRPELAFVLGRRRVGKSFLLAPFCRAVKGVYFQATRRTEAEQLLELSRIFGQRFEDPALLHGGGFPDWDSLLRYLLARANKRRLLFVLDEFPYLEDAAPALPSILQRFLDHEAGESLLKIVIAGSEITAMRRLERADQPLYARRTARVSLKPFRYVDVARFVPRYEPRDRLRAFGAFGGVPGHLALLDPSRLFSANVAEQILRPSARLHDEAQHMLDAFLGEAGVHYSVLDAIAGGQHTWGGITKVVGKRSGSLSRPVAWLIEMELVRRVVPVTVKRPDRCKRTLYRIDDPYVRFWHRFVAPLVRSGVSIGAPPARLFKERVKPLLDDYMGPVFEEVCRDFVRHSNSLGFRPVAVGEWWSRKAGTQIDVVALSGGDDVLVGECKWGKVAARDLVRLREKSNRLLPDLEGAARIRYALFSGGGPADRAIRSAIESGEVLHFGPEDLFEE